MLLQKRQPHLHRIRVSVADLDQPPQRDPLKVLLALLEDEVRPGHRPALRHARERHGPVRGQAEVVGCPQREVAEELEVAQRVGPQLQIARRHAVFRLAPERFEVERC